MSNSEVSQNEQKLHIIEGSPAEFDQHMAYVFRRYATIAESVLNLLTNGQHVAAWKKVQGMRDGLAYYMNAAEERISRNTNENNNDDQFPKDSSKL